MQQGQERSITDGDDSIYFNTVCLVPHVFDQGAEHREIIDRCTPPFEDNVRE